MHDSALWSDFIGNPNLRARCSGGWGVHILHRAFLKIGMECSIIPWLHGQSALPRRVTAFVDRNEVGSRAEARG